MGGDKPHQSQFIQPPPPQIIQAPPPPVGETSAQLAQSQLQYNPRLTAQQVALQQQYAPQLAQSEYNIQAKYGPMYRALYESMFPTQTQGLETVSRQGLERFQNPQGLTAEQQAAQDAIRNRAQERMLRGIRTQANIGGTLYGGNRERREVEAASELANRYAMQDIALQDQRRREALAEIVTGGQVMFPQVQQPGVPGFGQSVTPSPDALLAAYSQGQIINPAVYQQGTPGTPSFWGAMAQGYGAPSPTGY